MNINDDVIREWFYRLPKGYAEAPYTESELTVLADVIAEHDSNVGKPIPEAVELVTEAIAAPKFHNEIVNTFGEGNIPAVSKKYNLPEESGRFIIDTADHEAFIKLFTVVDSQGTGNGEISLYWLFNYQDPVNPSENCIVNHSRNQPDLTINGKYAEVKSYPAHDRKNFLGRFESKEASKLISKVFGVANTTRTLGSGKKIASKTQFNLDDMLEVVTDILDLKQILEEPDVAEALNDYDVFNRIKADIDKIFGITGIETNDPEVISKAIMLTLLEEVLTVKPGLGNYVINLLPNDPIDIHVTKIPEADIISYAQKEYDKIKNSIDVNSAQLRLSNALFDE